MADDKLGGSPALKRSIDLIVEALDLIDGFEGSPEAAVHLELALQELRGHKPRDK